MHSHIHTRLPTPPFPPPHRYASNPSFKLSSLNYPNSFLSFYGKPFSRISLHKFVSLLTVSLHSSSKTTEEEKTESPTKQLMRKIQDLGIIADSCTPGLYNLLYCPNCNGGQSIHRTLSFHISSNWSYAIWRCFNQQCGWAGHINSSKPLTGDSLRLEALADELLDYFAERKISKQTLDRNCVMQVAGDRKIIAFTYRRNGEVVGCKYRKLDKRFWQEKNTEKMLYGLDDIVGVDEIIIVEGELDKLSVEEAGYRNCVSVPSGAPQTVSVKELPCQENDTGFQYLWNCQEYLDKASRIVLATDGDGPGQALAEELSRRLGRERCWRVHWPKKDEFGGYYNDANEVLVNLGATGLRDTIDKAEFFKVQDTN